MYFIYPETCGVRLEDMDSLFGDATTAMGTPAAAGTPAMYAEGDALMRSSSPVPSLDIHGRAPFGSAAAIPGLNIDPPNSAAKNRSSNGGEGGTWFSRIFGRGRSSSASGGGGQYAPLDQGDD